MQELLIYVGIGIDLIGAIFLMGYAIKYSYLKRKNSPIEENKWKSVWAKKRVIGFGLIISGTIITLLGCLL